MAPIHYSPACAWSATATPRRRAYGLRKKVTAILAVFASPAPRRASSASWTFARPFIGAFQRCYSYNYLLC